MELMAVIKGLEALKRTDVEIIVFSDSRYVVDAIEKKWLNKWVTANCKGGKKNKDLQLYFYRLAEKLNLRFQWIQGHADNPYNERCDELANIAVRGKKLKEDKEYPSDSRDCYKWFSGNVYSCILLLIINAD